MAAEWGAIPRDLAIKIAEHIENYEDFETFSQVCSRWRSATTEAKFPPNVVDHHRHHYFPRLMLRDYETHLRFYMYTISKQCIVRNVELNKHLPLLSDDTTTWEVLSSHGWLFFYSRKKDLNLFLINPISGATIQLPKFHAHSLDWETSNVYHKFVLSANPSTTSNFSVAVLFSKQFPCFHHSPRYVAIWRNGADRWARMDPYSLGHDHRIFLGHCSSLYEDVTFYRGEFYAIKEYGEIIAFAPPRQVFPYFHPINALREQKKRGKLYLVEYDGRLLVIYRDMKYKKQAIYKKTSIAGWSFKYKTTSEEDMDWKTLLFLAYVVDVDNRVIKELNNLGDRAIFVGLNSSFSVKASPTHGCKPNCIYFTDHYYIHHHYHYPIYSGLDIGVYNFSDGKIEGCYNGPPLFDGFAPPMWVEPSPTCATPRQEAVELIKVIWSSNNGVEEETWETVEDMKERYPELFT